MSEQRKRMVAGAAGHRCPCVLGTGGSAGFAKAVLKKAAAGTARLIQFTLSLFSLH